MAEEAKKESRLITLIKDSSFQLSKLEVIKIVSEGEFNSKDIRGAYVVNSVTKVDCKNIKADITLHLNYGDQTKKFFDLECVYTVSIVLTQDVEREITTKNEDATDLFSCSLSYVDAIIGPILKAMGYVVKLG